MPKRAGCPHHSPTDIIPHCYGDCPVHCRKLSSVPGLSTHQVPVHPTSYDKKTMSAAIVKFPLRDITPNQIINRKAIDSGAFWTPCILLQASMNSTPIPQNQPKGSPDVNTALHPTDVSLQL